ncbi:tRNA-dihydrouridine(47) synthase [NAD(P)(+)]-like protein [Nowakowskiella sp. JEL0078]|nr:tRNA-dihydrouridine(47) synthase [NAD(P)(+)]-like protein [Nowakowskiella sp. JEL0078]
MKQNEETEILNNGELEIRAGDAKIKSQYILANIKNGLYPYPYDIKLETLEDSRDAANLSGISNNSLPQKRSINQNDDNEFGSIDVNSELELNAKRLKQDDLNESKNEPVSLQDQVPNSKRNRGMNVNRKFTHSKDVISICVKFLENACTFPNCKFSHNIDEYMAQKSEDIGPVCHMYESYGKCPHGVKCRFALAHTREDYSQIVDEEKIKTVIPWEKTVLNVVERSTQRELAKKNKNGSSNPKIDEYLKELARVQKERIPSRSNAGNITKETSVDTLETSKPLKEDKTVDTITEDGGNEEIKIEGKKKEFKEFQKSGLSTDNFVEQTSKNEKNSYPESFIRLRPQEKKRIDLRDKLYLAPLTTVGNLPFRRLCTSFGADITCGEMTLAKNLLLGNSTEWTHLRRHNSEKIFGIQLAGSSPAILAAAVDRINSIAPSIDFIDLNVGCPIDLVVNSGAGSALLDRPSKLTDLLAGLNYLTPTPITVKLRTGFLSHKPVVHKLIPNLLPHVAAIAIHGRSREQRYSRAADWEYIRRCVRTAHEASTDSENPVAVFGNGDILDYTDYIRSVDGVDGVMIGRGALIKPWLFTEIKERRVWDISSRERLDVLRDFANFGIEQWGCDTMGVNTTRRFLLEQLSFMHRYIPVGLLETLPQKMNERPPAFVGRDELETLMASPNVENWIKLSELVLGKAPDDFTFVPK